MKRAIASFVAAGLVGAAVAVAPARVTSPSKVPNANVGQFAPALKFTGVAFGDAIDFLRDISGLNITVNWKALAEANVTRDTPINVRLFNVSVRKALNVILTEAGGGDTLTFVIEDNVIEVTTRAIADQRLITRIYPIEDLVMEIPNFDDAPDFNLASSTSGGGGGQGGGGGGGLFTSSSGKSAASSGTKTREQRGQELIDLIVNTIRPDIWRENGGTASIRYFNGQLIVSAPRSVHEAIGG